MAYSQLQQIAINLYRIRLFILATATRQLEQLQQRYGFTIADIEREEAAERDHANHLRQLRRTLADEMRTKPLVGLSEYEKRCAALPPDRQPRIIDEPPAPEAEPKPVEPREFIRNSDDGEMGFIGRWSKPESERTGVYQISMGITPLDMPNLQPEWFKRYNKQHRNLRKRLKHE